MKATEAKLLTFLRKSMQFVIPIYQRTYSWTEKECQQLWDDILRAGRNTNIDAHFVGSIVYVQAGLFTVIDNPPLLVIDGQQRLTSLTLMLAALAEALDKLPEDKREIVEGFSPRKIRNYFLINQDEDGEKRHKLVLSKTDRTSLIAIVEQHEQPADQSLRVTQNYKLFQDLIAAHESELAQFCQGLAKLVIVDIALDRDHDNPQLIFESMNSTGRELSQADLIRNFILMGLEPKLQTKLYEQYWHPMEVEFGQEAYSTQFDSFMRHYLTMKTGEIPKLGEVYEAFKAHARASHVASAGVEALVKDIRTFGRYYCAMALNQEPEKRLAEAFHDLREFRVDVVYPFLLTLYDDYATKVLSVGDFLAALRTVESYVFRRAVCSIPTNSMNKTFATLAKSVKNESYLESIQGVLLGLRSYRRFPNDEEFHREIQVRDLYNFPRRSYWLRRMENFNRKERVSVDEYTIEHIMPQNEELSPAWRKDLGADWRHVHERWLHTLGNLTLTGYNSEYSDHKFTDKRDMEGGFKQSPILLSAGLGELDVWNEAAIKERGEQLASRALKVWALPNLKAEVIAKYRPKAGGSASYSIDDHKHLLASPAKELFEAFRKQVLALDPCVTEEFLKLYVAFKAETNFVDVFPRTKRLLLVLNMKFPDVTDPKGLCRDVTNLGRSGNGDVEVNLTELKQLPYVLGLVRQALERQLTNEGES